MPPPTTPSQILKCQIKDLVEWGVVETDSKAQSRGKIFLTPKSKGKQSRALYDARSQNSEIEWCALVEHGKFHLMRPFHHILVGLAFATKRSYLAEIDFVSYFFQFRWCRALGRAHGFEVPPSKEEEEHKYAFRVPVQGSAVMPLVAQATTAALTEAPSIRAHPNEWVDAGISIVYDNILIAGSEEDGRRRWESIRARCEQVGVVIGDTQAPTTRLTSCGVEFQVSDPERRLWRLSPE